MCRTSEKFPYTKQQLVYGLINNRIIAERPSDQFSLQMDRLKNTLGSDFNIRLRDWDAELSDGGGG